MYTASFFVEATQKWAMPMTGIFAYARGEITDDVGLISMAAQHVRAGLFEFGRRPRAPFR